MWGGINMGDDARMANCPMRIPGSKFLPFRRRWRFAIEVSMGRRRWPNFGSLVTITTGRGSGLTNQRTPAVRVRALHGCERVVVKHRINIPKRIFQPLLMLT